MLSESAYAGLQCNDGDPLPRLMLEAYFSAERPESCAPPKNIAEDIFLAVIPNWDGNANDARRRLPPSRDRCRPSGHYPRHEPG
ncbi:MAG: hypothetical protein JKY37_04215 [Nannocystaceae bacterium]|nr:hypothetical protein [Nannocystaceae bacterium]